MGTDLTHVVGVILTFSMFLTVGQMLHRDYFESVQDEVQGDAQVIEFEVSKVSVKDGLVGMFKDSKGLWMEDTNDLNPCWPRLLSDEAVSSKGYVTFSLTNGPEYHISQITDAVMVAKHLGATLVLPDIRGTKPGYKRNFEDIYDADILIKSLENVVKVVKQLPKEVSPRNMANVMVPTRVTEYYIKKHLGPIFKSKGNIRVVTYFPSVNMRKSSQDRETDPVSCLAMFGSLELQPELNTVVDTMIERLRTHSRESGGRFIAVDLRIDLIEKKKCHSTGILGSKTCYNAQEIALFLRKLGFSTDTTIYLTQPRWDSRLNILKDIFPKTFTKEAIMPRSKYLETKSSEYENAIDFYLCSRSHVFVPAIPGLFYANTVGKRIALGKPQVLVPAEISETSGLVTNFTSPYILKKNHLAYSCFR